MLLVDGYATLKQRVVACRRLRTLWSGVGPLYPLARTALIVYLKSSDYMKEFKFHRFIYKEMCVSLFQFH